MTFPRGPDILVVDDAPDHLHLLADMLKARGYKVRPVPSGRLALQAAASVPPDLILLDIDMPEMNGYEVCGELKMNPVLRDIPILFISALGETLDKVRAFRTGGVDYISKPFELEEVEARVNAHLKLVSLRREAQERAAQLEATQATLRKELARAGEYAISFIPPPLVSGAIQTDWRVQPSEQLGGDSLGYQWLDPERFAFYLFDVSGHGISSALLSVSVLNLLRSTSLPGVDFSDPAAVLAALNAIYLMREQRALFFTMWYGVFDLSRRRLVYAGAGHPPAIVCDAVLGVQRLGSESPPVGCGADIQFVNSSVSLAEGAQLYLFSDGLIEARRNAIQLAYGDLIEFLSGEDPPRPRTADHLWQRALQFAQGEPFNDDCSILHLCFL
jgi:phosphoserine phosphatase RsbU/P